MTKQKLTGALATCEHCYTRQMQTKLTSGFRKTAETFQPGAKTLPQRYFVSPEIFAEELQKIFATDWVLVGHQSQLAQPGDYFLAEVAGESLIVDEGSTIDNPRLLQRLPSPRGATLRRANWTCVCDSVSLPRVELCAGWTADRRTTHE